MFLYRAELKETNTYARNRKSQLQHILSQTPFTLCRYGFYVIFNKRSICYFLLAFLLIKPSERSFGANCFLSEYTPLQREGENNFDSVTSSERKSVLQTLQNIIRFRFFKFAFKIFFFSIWLLNPATYVHVLHKFVLMGFITIRFIIFHII